MNHHRIVILVLVVVGCTNSAQSAIITLAENGYAPPTTGSNTYSFTGRFRAENFVLGEASIVTALSHVALDDPTASPTSFDWRIHANSGSLLPGTILAMGDAAAFTRVVEGVYGSGLDYARFDINVGAISLGPGTYWMSLHANGGQSAPDWVFASNGLGSPIELPGSAVTLTNGDWATDSSNFNFRLQGHIQGHTIPEPSTWLIWSVLGLASLWRLRRGRGC